MPDDTDRSNGHLGYIRGVVDGLKSSVNRVEGDVGHIKKKVYTLAATTVSKEECTAKEDRVGEHLQNISSTVAALHQEMAVQKALKENTDPQIRVPQQPWWESLKGKAAAISAVLGVLTLLSGAFVTFTQRIVADAMQQTQAVQKRQSVALRKDLRELKDSQQIVYLPSPVPVPVEPAAARPPRARSPRRVAAGRRRVAPARVSAPHRRSVPDATPDDPDDFGYISRPESKNASRGSP